MIENLRVEALYLAGWWRRDRRATIVGIIPLIVGVSVCAGYIHFD
jgi:hypothetical protein